MIERIGVVVHPTRDIDQALAALREWAERHDAELVQVAVHGQDRRVAEVREAKDTDVVVAVGGDGTTLAAARAAALSDRPVLGVACGSLGVLTTVDASDAAQALERFVAGDWDGFPVAALSVQTDDGPDIFALNDIAVTRRGQGQVTTAAKVDGALYARFAGDGFVVATPIGSSAYNLAAGGPLIAPAACAHVLTPLAPHGGAIPPLVVDDSSELKLEIEPGYGGMRLEVDGQPNDAQPTSLTVGLRRDAVKVVVFDDTESILAGLRRRNIIIDSPRVLARDKRESP